MPTLTLRKVKREARFPKDPTKSYADGLFGRLVIDDRLYFTPIEIRRQNPVPVEGVTSYVYRNREREWRGAGKAEVTNLGKDLEAAFTKWRELDADAERVRQGKAPLHTGPEIQKSERLSIADAVSAFIRKTENRLKTGKIRPKTAEAYKKAVSDFRSSVKVIYVDEITPEVLTNHETWLYENLKRRSIGEQQNTIVNHFNYINILFRGLGIKTIKDKNAEPSDKGLLPRDEAPKTIDKVIDVYSEDEIRTLMKAANVDAQELFQFLLYLGVRDEEAAYAQWSDIEPGPEGGFVFHVQRKAAWNWVPKHGKTRKIAINEKLYGRLTDRKERLGKTGNDLIFPNGKGEPDSHLIDRLHKVWNIVQESAKTNDTLNLTGRAELHRFRRTFITGLLKKGESFRDVMEVSGHSDLKSFMRYIKASGTFARSGVEKFSSYGD